MSCSMTKPTKWPVRPAKTLIILGIRPVWSAFAVRLMGSKGTVLLQADSEDWSECVDGHADQYSLGVHVILLVLSCCGSKFVHVLSKTKGHNSVRFICLRTEQPDMASKGRGIRKQYPTVLEIRVSDLLRIVIGLKINAKSRYYSSFEL